MNQQRFSTGLLGVILAGYFGITLPTLAWWPPLQYDECWIGSVADKHRAAGALRHAPFWKLSRSECPVPGSTARPLPGSGHLPPTVRIRDLAAEAPFRTFWGWNRGFYLSDHPGLAGLATGPDGRHGCVFGRLCLSDPILAPGISSVSTSGRHDVTGAFFATWTLWSFFGAERSGSRWLSMQTGLAAGLALLTHPVALILLPLFLLFRLTRSRAGQLTSASPALISTTCLLTISPWIILLILNWELASRELAAFNASESVGDLAGRFPSF